MAGFDNENDYDPSKPITPAFDNEKLMAELTKKSSNTMNKVIEAAKKLNSLQGSLEPAQQDELQSKMDFLLKAAVTVDNSLQELVDIERRGKNPQLEGMLTQFIELVGTSLDQDIEYGLPISQEQRLKWQALGMDPESENEVEEFLERNGIIDSRNPDKAPTHNMKK